MDLLGFLVVGVCSVDTIGFPVVDVGSVEIFVVLVVGAGSVDSLGFSVVVGSVGGTDSTCTYKKNNLYLNR